MPKSGTHRRRSEASGIEPGQGSLSEGRVSPKAQVIDYYIRIAPVLLPHLEGPAAHDEALSQMAWKASFSTKRIARRIGRNG